MRNISKVTCLQQDSTDCGAACLLSVLRYYGGYDTLEHVRELCGTNVQGTSLLVLYDVAKLLELKVKSYKADIEYIKGVQCPHILHIHTEDGLLHYVVLWSYKDGVFCVSDPAYGVGKWSESDMTKKWRDGICMSIEKGESFISSKCKSRQKLRWLYGMVASDWPVYVCSVVLGVVTSLFGFSTSVFSQKLIDVWLPAGNIRQILISLLFLLVILVVQAVVSSARGLVLSHQGKELNIGLMRKFLDRMMSMPLRFFENRKVGDIISRLKDVGTIQRVICSLIGGNLVLNILILFFSFIILFYYSKAVFTVLAVSLPVLTVLLYCFNKRVKDGQYGVMSSNAAVESHFISMFQFIRFYKVFDVMDRLYSYSDSIYTNNQDCSFRLSRLQIKLSLYFSLVTVLDLVLIMIIGSYQVVEGLLSIGSLTAVIAISNMIIPAIVELSSTPIYVSEARIAFDRVYDITNREENSENNPFEEALDLDSVDLYNITFRYTSSVPLLNDISFSFKRGVLYGIIGESGVGKSTLCKILERSYLPTQGSVLYNGLYDYRNISQKKLYASLGVVTQDIPIINGTLIENICPLEDDKDTLIKALNICNSMGFDRFIAGFVNGYNTVVGETGLKLSGGERQMLALMRIVVRRPKLIILDEPTSAMDRNMEQFALKVIQELKSTAIVIMVTHKFHLLKKYADQICVLNGDKGIISGTHSELLGFKNIYSQYWSDVV